MSEINSRLLSRNVTIEGHRTSLRLEEDVWDAFDEICLRENVTAHQLCEVIERNRKASSRTAAVRAFILAYFRRAATDQGHSEAGHGDVARSMLTAMA